MNELVVNNYPKSSITEAIKTIRANLRFSAVNKKIQTILITSSMAGEGKSFVSANLAATFANATERVLLIDCDLRNGRIKSMFNVKNKSNLGLSNLLIDDEWYKNFKSYVNPTKIKNLHIITSGSIPPNPSLLLESKKMSLIVENLRKIYDVIIFDTPSVTGLTDALVMTNLADASLIVVRAKKTPFEVLQNTKKALENVGANVAGVILNRVDVKDTKY